MVLGRLRGRWPQMWWPLFLLQTIHDALLLLLFG
jgi:hypothetical protein